MQSIVWRAAGRLQVSLVKCGSQSIGSGLVASYATVPKNLKTKAPIGKQTKPINLNKKEENKISQTKTSVSKSQPTSKQTTAKPNSGKLAQSIKQTKQIPLTTKSKAKPIPTPTKSTATKSTAKVTPTKGTSTPKTITKSPKTIIKAPKTIIKAPKSTILAPQVGDIENKGKKEIQKEALVKSEKIKEVEAKGELVEEDAIESVGETVKGDAKITRPTAKMSKAELAKQQKEEKLKEKQRAKKEEDAEEEGSEDPALQGYGEETYDFFSRNVAKLGKDAYSHYVEKIKAYLELDQQYFATRLFTFMQRGMSITPDLYELIIESNLKGNKFTSAFFYLNQMKTRDLQPSDATLDSFVSYFSRNPNKANQAKFESLVSSFGLPAKSQAPVHRRGRGQVELK